MGYGEGCHSLLRECPFPLERSRGGIAVPSAEATSAL